jgi:hypothetical protein
MRDQKYGRWYVVLAVATAGRRLASREKNQTPQVPSVART